MGPEPATKTERKAPMASEWEKGSARFLAGVGRIERVITFVAFLILVAVIFSDVVSRELTGTGLHWARQAGVYANIFVIMVGIGVASAHNAHLRPRFADHWLPESWEPVLKRGQEFIMALFCLTFSLVAVQVVAESYALQERSSVLETLVWPVQTIIPVVFLTAAIRHFLYGCFPLLRAFESPDDSPDSRNDDPKVF
jgi:TRAP-type C4-dicarboxylate transport system permease small subunit